MDSAHCGEDNGASPTAEPHFCWTQQERYKVKGLSALIQLPAPPQEPALGDLFSPIPFYLFKQEGERGPSLKRLGGPGSSRDFGRHLKFLRSSAFRHRELDVRWPENSKAGFLHWRRPAQRYLTEFSVLQTGPFPPTRILKADIGNGCLGRTRPANDTIRDLLLISRGRLLLL